jgi:CYTH domain-containing protein
VSVESEIERKWLVDGTWADIVWGIVFEDSVIVQTYLIPMDDKATERIRQRTRGTHREWTHTIKHPTDRLGHRLEAEREITEDEYNELLERKDPTCTQVVKVRRVFEWDGRTWELDHLSGYGVMLLECELPDLDSEVRTPPWLPIIREVTDDPAWTNASIARNGV